MKNTKLTQKQLEKFVRMLRKNSQKEAIIDFLGQGHELSLDEARLAGVADPARVVYSLRCEGYRIYTNPRKTKDGRKVMCYRLA